MEQNVESKRKKILKNVLLAIECVIIAICVIFSIIVITQPGTVGKNGNKTKFMPVMSDSMTPTIPVGSLIVTEKPSSEKYDLGTIVTFVANDNGINFLDTHRIVGYRYADNTGKYQVDYLKKGEMVTFSDWSAKHATDGAVFVGYITRGDSKTVAYSSFDDCSIVTGEYDSPDDIDDSVSRFHHEILAVYSYRIVGIGAVLSWLMNPTNFFIVILIPLILLFIYNVYGLVRMIIANKVAKVKEESQVDEEEIKRRAIEEYLKAQNGGQPAENTETVEANSEKTDISATNSDH